MRGTGFAHQPNCRGSSVAEQVLLRVLGLSLRPGLLFRETNLDEELVQRVLERQWL